MFGKPDVEAGEGYAPAAYEAVDHERETLLPTTLETDNIDRPPKSPQSSSSPFCTNKRFGVLHLLLAFGAGTLACIAGQFIVCGPNCFTAGKVNTGDRIVAAATVSVLAPPYVGSTERHHFPPASPTNAYPTLFPTNVGYAGGTPTGAEPAVIATAPYYPVHKGAAQLVAPATLGKKTGKGGSKGFDLFKKWGNLSPWYSVDRTAFGLNSGPEIPKTCRVTGLHLLHRHGARYPTAWGEFIGTYLKQSEY